MSNQSTWLQRVIEERNELNEKIKRLYGFITSPALADLAEEPAGLLQAQYAAMNAYAEILTARIILAGNGKQQVEAELRSQLAAKEREQ